MFVPVPGQQPKKEKDPPIQIEQSMIVCALHDEEGNPMKDIKYEIILPDGNIRKGATDSNGKVLLTGIPVGRCKVSFPDLHSSEWD